MSSPVIRIDADRVRAALSRFAGNMQGTSRAQLMRTIGLGQLSSIYKTFAEEGSPSGSWPALAASTVKRLKGKAAGHKLLIGRGTLRASIRVQSDQSHAIIGTGLVYAPVHQFGSRDRGSTAVGPRTEAQQKATVKVGQHSYTLKPKLQSGYRFRNFEGPRQEGKQRPRMRYQLIGPRNLSRTALKSKNPRRQALKVNVRGYERHQNIPARPFLVFRPEDPARIEEQVQLWTAEQARAAGLEAH